MKPVQLEIQIFDFSDLTVDLLYQILALRSQIFVVEQQCIYQDIDLKDQKALHVLGYIEGKLVAYSRIFEPGAYFLNASIGRVAVSKLNRNQGLGYQIMKAAIAAIAEQFKQRKIEISAQTYLINFYKNLGFSCIGDSYLEDDIPHIKMIKE